MPLQNRVTPFGDLVAVPERGTFMGNRGGCLHTPDKRLGRRRWISKRWILCALEFKGRRRTPMTPGRYTELFFLDEATALAAGHRPCRECQRERHECFKQAWLRGNPEAGLSAQTSIDRIDEVLHAERVGPGGSQGTYRARLRDLPDGVFVTVDREPDTALLVARGCLWPWTPGGYATPVLPEADGEATVLTPRSTVRAIAAGYRPCQDFFRPSRKVGRRGSYYLIDPAGT
jgi:hypothetical protein